MKNMKNRWIHNRLRKYARKKFKKSDPLALKYWSYWFKLYGSHKQLWNQTGE